MPTGIYQRSEEYRRKLSLAHKGKKLSEEHRKKLSQNSARYWLGKHRSKETRDKISQASKGRKLSEEHRKKISEALRGHPLWGGMTRKHHSEETKRKISKANKGKKRSAEWKKHLSERMKGKRGASAPNWKDGNRKRKDERNDSLYQLWVRQVKKRDNWQCRINNEECYGRVVAHHILPWRDFPELRYNINNGITLCQAHHPRKRAKEKRLILSFSRLVLASKEQI